MRIIKNNILPPKGKTAIMLFGIIFTRDKSKITPRIIRHEEIHVRQMWELLIVGFYIWYLVEICIRWCLQKDAYHKISFEREAFANQEDIEYLKKRSLFNFLNYL